MTVVRRRRPPRDAVTLGQALRLARKEAGLTQAELGAEIGLPEGRGAVVQISRWETDATIPGPRALRALCDVLGVDFVPLWAAKKLS